jgi:hypothetical protein
VIQEKRTIIFKKLTDISKQNTIFVKDVDARTDCIGSRNTSGWGTDLEITMYSKSRVDSDKPSGYGQTNSIKNRRATNFAFKNINKKKSIKMPPPQMEWALRNLI